MMAHTFLMLILLATANGVPILAASLFGDRYNYPADGGLRLSDGRHLFGASKTFRGIILSLLITPLVSMALGVGPRFGLVVAVLAMCGDLISSFLKRRLNLQASDQARGLDQIPESLLPCLAGISFLGMRPLEVLQTVLLFYVIECAVSPLLFRMKIRNRPY
jgi:hypothetical protein